MKCDWMIRHRTKYLNIVHAIPKNVKYFTLHALKSWNNSNNNQKRLIKTITKYVKKNRKGKRYKG